VKSCSKTFGLLYKRAKLMQRNLITYVIIALIVVGLGSIAMMLTVQNRPGGPEDETAVVEPTADTTGQVAVDQTVAEQPAAEVPVQDSTTQTLVAYTVDVGGMPINITAVNEEQVRLAPEAIQPVVEQPAVEQPAVEQPAVEQPAVEQPAVEVVQPVEPTPIPTAVPVVDTNPQPAAVVGQANTAVNQYNFINYTVTADDTLFRITQNYNTSIELMARYGISSDDMVNGTVISLPIANPEYCPNMRPYVVREKETAYAISHQFGVELEALRSANYLDANYSLLTTQVVCIP
jgi:LysM repeat protein